MQPFQYDLRCSAAKDNSITHAAAARSNLDTAITMRSAETELQNTIELRATASETAAPKPDLDAKAAKRRFWSTFWKDFFFLNISAKIEKICWHPYYLRRGDLENVTYIFHMLKMQVLEILHFPHLKYVNYHM